MRLLDRYLLRELLVPLMYCLGGFLLFWITFDVFAELGKFQRRSMSLWEVTEYYVRVTPEFVVLVLPIALLLALLYTLTNHARHNEITAIRAAGVSVWRLSLPYTMVGLFLSLLAFLVNELWVPQSVEAAEKIIERRAGSAQPGGKETALGFTNTRDGRIWHVELYDPETSEMLNPQVFWTARDGARMSLKADRGLYTNDVWTFFNATQYRAEPGTNVFPEPVLTTNVLAVPSFTENPELVKSEIKVSRSISLRREKQPDLAVAEILNYLRLHPKPPASDRAWLHTKLQGRFAVPWTCLVVVLIAIPFGAASGRRNVFVGVASSILICFVYFVLQQLSLALGTGRYLPPWMAAWLPNIVFGCTGLILTARMR